MKSILIIVSLVGVYSIAYSQETQIKGFFDSQGAMLKSSTDGKSHGFALGQLDLFITSQIDDKTSFLGETVFEWDEEAQSFVVDVERIFVRYSFSDNFNLATGKFFSPIGYWNATYNHGALIQPTIQRPNIIRFEDEGGFLPIHQVGLQLDGTGITSKNIGYNLFISNGQAQGNSGGSFSYASTPAVSGAVSVEPVENLKFIASGYYNNVPAGAKTYQGVILTENSSYTMLNASVAYFNGSLPIEFSLEYYNVTNSMDTSGSSNMNGAYAYLGFKQFKLIPYVVYNSIKFQQSEKYFNKNNLDGVTAGIRYGISAKAVVKAEYSHETTDLISNQDLFRFQIAIGF